MIYSPVTRLFTILDLLQSRPGVTSAQLAERLGVEARSVRRYVTMLQDLGIPVEAVRGRYGGYRLRPGFKLPPLMWTDEEAVAVTLGLLAAERLGMVQTVPTVKSALAKVERVLPQALRERVQAIQQTVAIELVTRASADRGRYVMALSTAAFRHQRVWMRYQGSTGTENERNFDCYGLVYHNEQWYAVGYCHLRQEIRVFRLDRIRALEAAEEQFTPPASFDCLGFAIEAFAAIPSRWLAEVVLHNIDLTRVRETVPAEFATLEERPDGILLRAYDDDLEHTARFLIGLGCPFQVLQPVELVEELHRPAMRILRMTASDEDRGG
jgi:predicted DNA-binding transcriptional regulator YafY